MISKCNTCVHRFEVTAPIQRKVGDPTVQTEVKISFCLLMTERDQLLKEAVQSNYTLTKEDGSVIITSCSRYESNDKQTSQIATPNQKKQ